MTLDVEPTRPIATKRPRKFNRKKVLIALAVFAVLLAGYLVRYGQCEARSKFCVADIVGTRSEVGFEWDSWSFYVSTWPNG